MYCPEHKDSDFGNCYVYMNTLLIYCFRCHFRKGLVNYIAEQKSITINEAKAEIGLTSNVEYTGKRKKNEEELPKRSVHRETLESLVDFDPQEFEYTRLRGYTREFLKEFGIKLCYSGKYTDYMIIPIKELNTFEARKLKEKEKLSEFFKTDGELSTLRSEYKKWRKLNKNITHSALYYLDRPKTLYEPGVLTEKPLIFNESKLDYNSDVYFSEGTASLPKIWRSISKNCSCTFGAILSKKQIETLKLIKGKKIIIPDNDEASLIMARETCMNIPNMYICPVSAKDTDPEYEDQVKSTPIIRASEFAMSRVFNKLGL